MSPLTPLKICVLQKYILLSLFYHFTVIAFTIFFLDREVEMTFQLIIGELVFSFCKKILKCIQYPVQRAQVYD